MNAEFMNKVHQSDATAWSLPQGRSLTLRVGPGARAIQVLEGRLWLTSPGNARDASIDVWLVAGDTLELPAGLEVVMEAWPKARFCLLVPPCTRPARTLPRLTDLAGRAAGWFRSDGWTRDRQFAR